MEELIKDKNIAIITLMRKGSKRFPNKVMAPLLGKPLWKWTAEIGLWMSEEFGFSYYLAHDYDFNEIEIPEGVFEIKRLERFAGDKHKTCEEIKSFNIDADVYIFLQSTNPIRNRLLIKFWLEDFFKKYDKYDCAFSAISVPTGYYYDEQSNAVNYNRNDRTDNGCEKNTLYKETGNFYIFKKSQLEKKHILNCSPEKTLILKDLYMKDIDTPLDLQIVESSFIGMGGR